MKRVGIVGSRKYTNRRKIKEFVFKLKETFQDKVEIVSGGQKQGADGYAKKFAIEFDMKYVEFPPRHYTYNQHCILDESHYGKRYFPKNFTDRNKQIVEYSDYIVAFMPSDNYTSGTMDTVSIAEKLNKKVIILN
tara:strand:+ start:122 stop:526 length:405 start_codon:yes stop_codon:yes gene_type:complete